MYKSTIFGAISTYPSQTSPNTPKIKFSNSIVSFVSIVHPCEQIDRVLKTHSNCDNSNNTIGRQLKFTSEVTLIGPHIVSKFQPNPTIFGKVIHHFVHGSFFQDHPQRAPARVIASKSIWYFFQDHFGSFKTIFYLVYLQHNGRTAHFPATHIPLALQGPADSLRGVAESCHPRAGSIQYPQREMVCQHCWFPGHQGIQ